MDPRVAAAISHTSELVRTNRYGSVAPFLPLLLRLDNSPYSLRWSHFMMEPMFRMRNSPQRMLWRTARQVSKCLAGDSLVTLASGEQERVDRLVIGSRVVCVNQSLDPDIGLVASVFDNGIQDTCLLTTAFGSKIRQTSNHRYLTPNGYVPVRALKPGDRIARPVSAGEFAVSTSTVDDKIKFIAYMIGDGSCVSGNFNFTSMCPESLFEMSDIATRHNVKFVRRNKPLNKAASLCFSQRGQLITWMREDGLYGKHSFDKVLPNWVFGLPRDKTILFISRLWATDGHIAVSKTGMPCIGYATTSGLLAGGVQSLLRKLGIFSTITRRQTGYKKQGVYHPCRDVYNLRVASRSAQDLFVATINHVPGKPVPTFRAMPSNNNRFTIPAEANRFIREAATTIRSGGNSLYENGLKKTPGYLLSRAKAAKYLDIMRVYAGDSTAYNDLKKLCNENIIWDTVKSVTPCQACRVYDIEVTPHHNFIVDGLVSHNSTSLAASQLVRAALEPNYKILTIAPLFEQVRKFSQNVVKPFIRNATVKALFADAEGSDSVLQRNLGNGSILFYSYSNGDPSRIRGISGVSECAVDEVQDADLSDLPVIEACMSASRFRFSRYAGTPKTFDNTIHLLWEDSSQAIWHIPCQATGCKHLNRCCATDGDMLKMLQPSGLSCAKCGQPLDSHFGFFIHGFPERQLTFPGYHVGQPILPMHYESPRNWKAILDFQRDKPAYSFYNEVLGESYDTGSKLITQADLVAAAVVEPREPRDMPRGRYVATGMGIDWGGRGKEKTSDTEDFISNTAIAIGGILPDGTIEIPWIHKIPYTIDTAEESAVAANAAMGAGVYYIGMDYGGQGNVQETLLVSRGWPLDRIVPFTYSVMAPTRPLVYYSPPAGRGVRSSYTLDKPRSLLLLCEMIKRGFVKLPKSDRYISDHLRDFLNIMEESIDNPRGSPRKLVKRMARRTDDVVHAVNFLVMSLLHSTQAWPKMAEAFVEKDD